MSAWEVPGYEVLELLGFGSSGEVWRARERSSGSRVVLRRLAGGDRAAVTAVRAQATIVRSLPTPHVIRLRTTTRAQRDDVLVLDHASGGSLAALLRRRGTLEPGEVVTVVAPLAEALGQAHAHDLVHGRLGAASVLLTAEGMPLLDGLGMAALHDPEDSLDPTGGLGATADVWALGALAHLLLTGQAPGGGALAELAPQAPLPLVQAVESALGFDPTARPTAADLAAALLASCPPLPVDGIVAAPEPAPPPARFSLPGPVRRTALVGAGLMACLAVVSAVGWAWGSRSATDGAIRVPSSALTHAARVAPRLQVPATQWRAALEALDTARSAAFAQADPSRLEEVYAPGAPGLAVDRRQVTALARLRRTALGVEHDVTSVTPLTVSRDRVELTVVEALSGFEVLDGAGAVVEEHPPGPVARHVVVLVSTGQGWRVTEVRPA